MSVPENQAPIDPVVAAGATSHTSGFVQPSESSSAPSVPVTSGSTSTSGLNSSSAAPHAAILGSAGIPAQFGYMGGAFGVTNYAPGAGGLQSSPNVPAPGSSIDPSTGKQFSAGMTRAELEAKKAAELSGREQAARQLAGPGLAAGPSELDVITPGKELPGGWGPTPVLPAPGTSTAAPASIYEDVNQVLLKVGSTAYAALPASLKEALSNNPEHYDKGKQPAGQPSSRRSSVAVLFDNAKKQTTDVINALREESKSEGPVEKDTTSLKGGPEGRRPSRDQPSIFGQVKELFQEAVHGDITPGASGVAGAATFKTSMPSEEPLGARPGEHVSGVGALPGPSNETGVAVLPDEKVASTSGTTSTSLPSQENQGLLPGEVNAGVGDLPGSKDEAGVAILPDEKATGSSGLKSDVAGTSSLAPPLPQTTLGTGASEGATDLEAVPGIAPIDSANSSLLPTAPTNERTDSFASTTAIRHGHEGNNHHESSPLASATPAVAAIDEKSTPSTEANESDKVVDDKAVVPVQDEKPVVPEVIPAAPSSTSDSTGPIPVKASESAVVDSPTHKTTALPTSNHSAQSPVSKTAASDASHRRTSSNSSNGKKKAGFMNKLKGEIKVISGKIGGDEAKVQAGERLKHGGE